MELRRSRRLQGLEPLEFQCESNTQEVVRLSYVPRQQVRGCSQFLGFVGTVVAALTLTRVVAAAVSLPGYTLF
jgi:hypothetical protein